MKLHPRTIDLAGETFGRLYVLSPVGRDKQGNIEWSCKCSCGSDTIATSSRLRVGKVKSCGCLRKERSAIHLAKVAHLNSGPRSPSWKGGVTPESQRIRTSKEYHKWRLDVFKRDSFTCQYCGETGGNLNAHHILSFSRYPEAQLVVDNGSTLCKDCHKEFHNLYGVLKFTDKNYWEWVGN